MIRTDAVHRIRERLKGGGTVVGSWMQLPSSSVAEIMGAAGYDWVAIDVEHGAIHHGLLPDLCRALELGGTLPLVRLAEPTAVECKHALDAGAGGVIIPMVRSADQLRAAVSWCRWPPAGTRGVGFSRANLFGARFDAYLKESQAPLIIAQIEDAGALGALDEVLRVPGLDATMIGPYDLSATLGVTGNLDSEAFRDAEARYLAVSQAETVPAGIHVVEPSDDAFRARIAQGYRFVAYSLDAVFLTHAVRRPGRGTSPA